jgi:hypothetical protein
MAMGLSNFPRGVSSFGIPMLGGFAGIPFSGNYFFVNPTSGSDGNKGTSPGQPFKTIQGALLHCVSGNNDCIFLEGNAPQTATINWNLNQTHLFGVSPPTLAGKQAKISCLSGATPFNTLVNVTGLGCYFSNFGATFGFPTGSAALNWVENGGDNCYDNVEFLGFGDATVTTGTANLTAARALTIHTNNNSFRNCLFGADAVIRNAANATLELTNAASRNSFEDCTFEAQLGSSAAAAVHVLGAATNFIDFWTTFKRCRFYNDTKSGATAMSQAFNLASSAGGFILLDGCWSVGATAIEATPTNNIYINMAAVSASSGLGINN